MHRSDACSHIFTASTTTCRDDGTERHKEQANEIDLSALKGEKKKKICERKEESAKPHPRIKKSYEPSTRAQSPILWVR